MKLSTIKPRKNTAQAMVEFAIVLPLLLLLLYGLLEAGRLLFIYSTIVTASRQAARYGSATGEGINVGILRYQDCAGIRAAAQRVDFLNAFDDDDIVITYDDGPGTAGPDPSTDPPAAPPWKDICDGPNDVGVSPTNNSTRIVVTIRGDYNPIVPRIVPFLARTRAGGNPVRAISARTILTGVAIEVTPPPGPSGGGGAFVLSISPNPGTYSTLNQQINYTFTLTNNTSAVINGPFTVTVDGTPPPFTVDCTGIASLAAAGSPGSHADCIVVPYFITQPNIDAGSFTITATAGASGGLISNQATATITYAPPTASLSLSVTPSPANYVNVGDVITYTYQVTNGIFDVYGLTISDNKVGSITCAANLPANTSTTCSATYSITAEDIALGSIVNTATANATDGLNAVVSPPASATATLAAPGLALSKTVAPQTSIVDGTVTYNFTLTNTGNVPLTEASVSDPMLGAVAGCSGDLAVGGQITCSQQYVIKAGDVVNQKVTNTATATAAFGAVPVQAQGQATLNILSGTLFVEVFVSPTSVSQPQNITYTYKLTNGTADNLFGPYVLVGSLTSALNNCFTGTLASGSSQTCVATYPISQTEFDAGGTIQNNNIQVTACKQSGNNCSRNNEVVSNVVSATPVTMSGQNPILVMQVVASPTVATTLNRQVSYIYRLINIGSVTLKQPFSLNDPKFGSITCSTTDIIPGAFKDCTKTYNVTQADIDAGTIASRQATASATYGSQTVTANAVVPAVVTFQGARLRLQITANPTTYPPTGQVILFTYVLTNTGSEPYPLSGPYFITNVSGPNIAWDCFNATSPLVSGASTTCTGQTTLSGAPGSSVSYSATARASSGTVNVTSNTASVVVNAQTPICTATPVTLTPTADAWVDENNTSTNHGGDPSLSVQSRNNNNQRALVRFSLPSLPLGCVIQNATLRLNASASAPGRTLQALQVASSGNWIENTVTWGTQPATTGTAATTSSGSGNIQWNVTTIVQAMTSGTNNGFLIRDQSENAGPGSLQQFSSRESNANQPQLLITYGQAP